ncbi:MAG: hypothetical protein A2722_04255 [Candidatus Doudnabacteria bacterium RIFCSPHIGHO2_01_FULL_50_11]|uniref:DNA replication and repair protein RecF n=1 Tax=Candidatus Doudnabacteria bacterium RIFCSPHIGHO2_01_FULL_50_11 TaxID=1817828 RepID=A0A1F5PGZ5_9BACT|nr:MAG: hypothetical protein A2722_04255 [Candidatus Doudnabacteria bacterium RIFCSPHIGHO2_01_FULL_50_11]HLC44932.1 DNA replication and repair protein RecF [Patescibacteria group bacterium]
MSLSGDADQNLANVRISKVTTENFRNLKNLEWDVAQDFVILVGPNASGKTNFLESIFYASTLQAFPPGKSWEIITFGSDYFRVSFEIEQKGLEYYYGRKENNRYMRSQRINGIKKMPSQILGALPSVSFLPQDLNLLRLSPGVRREYLDEVLLQTESEYEEVMIEYAKVLTQRNELLYRIALGQAQEQELDFWDQKLSFLGSTIMGARTKLAEFLNAGLEDVYTSLTGSEIDLRFLYTTSGIEEISQENIYDQLLRHRNQDVASGRTETGPHRDDWRIEDSNTRNLARFLSRGEQRSVIIALKMQEFQFLKDVLGVEPVMLLDELLAELDKTRQGHLLNHLPPKTQKFLTTTDIDALPESVVSQALIITIPK